MKKKGLIIAGCTILLLAAGGGAFYYMNQQTNQTDQPPMPPGMGEDMEIVAATGTTSTGLSEKELEFGFLDAELMVDEVYVSSADEVEKGDKVLKITDNSLLEATRELERAHMDASLAYRQGVIDYESGKLEAENELKKSRIAADFAQAVYEDAIAKAQADVTRAERAVADAQEIVDEYTDAIENDYYYTEYEIEAKKAAYEKNVALFFEKLDDYGYELDDEEDDDGDPNTFDIVKKDTKGGSSQDSDGELTVLKLLKSEYQENKEEYDQALKDYEAATEKAKAGIEEATNTLQQKNLELQEAQIDLEKAQISAQADYDLAVIKGEKAQATYDTEIKRLKEELETLADEETEAQENYELFMSVIGDGYIYTENAGTILMVRAIENTALAKEDILMAYSDADTIQVTASVDQADISQIKVGDVAAVVMEDYDTYTGVVSKINPVSASESRASVSYTVVLDLEGDISQLSANITANVYFGITGEEYDELSSQQSSRPQMGGMPQDGNGELPQEGMPQDGNGELPQEGMPQDRSGELPQGDVSQDMGGNMPQGAQQEQ